MSIFKDVITIVSPHTFSRWLAAEGTDKKPKRKKPAAKAGRPKTPEDFALDAEVRQHPGQDDLVDAALPELQDAASKSRARFSTVLFSLTLAPTCAQETLFLLKTSFCGSMTPGPCRPCAIA